MSARPTTAELDRVARLTHDDPHSLLGPHKVDKRWSFRAFWPGAEELRMICDGGRPQAMQRVHEAGIFEVAIALPERPAPADYRIEAKKDSEWHGGSDPYAFKPVLGELDLHLLAEGKHLQLWRVLGAHPRDHQHVTGTSFAVWAPAAQRVSVVGDFNAWDGRWHAMRKLGSGIWEIFVPAVPVGALYKFEILTAAGTLQIKADPMAQAMQLRPHNACRVTRSCYLWQDDEWVKQRASINAQSRPMVIYEVHLGAWKQHPDPPPGGDRPAWYSYTELAQSLVPYVVDMGFTHIEIMPIAEYPLDASWGYQVGGYYAPTCRYGEPDELRYLIDQCHQHGIGVILDWVPAHFPKDSFGLGRFDGTALYEHLDPRLGEHRQWGTYVFNYGRSEVRNFLVANALYWLEEFHVDGLRADAVASLLYLDYGARDRSQWLPNCHGGRENLEAIAFLREVSEAIRARHSGCVFMAEESTDFEGVTHSTSSGGLGFDFKWNMGWMHDTLSYFARDPIHRKFHHDRLTFGLVYAFSEHFVLPLSHDEVVHLKKSMLSKMPGDRWQMFANLRALYAHMWAHPGKKLLFMGGEFGQWCEWDETRELDWRLLDDPSHAGLQKLLRDLNRKYCSLPALYRVDHHSAGFRWIDPDDSDQSVLSYMRIAPKNSASDDADSQNTSPQTVICICNLTPVPRRHYRIGVPDNAAPNSQPSGRTSSSTSGKRYVELINTDATAYGGSGLGNLGAVEVCDVASHGFRQSLSLTLPPLATLWLASE